MKKILVVDDDPVFSRAISMRLGAEGFEVVTAQDGAAAIHSVREGMPDLILLDILFPPDVAHGGGVCWDGFLIMDWLRRMAGIGDTPVILMTAADPKPHMDHARNAGAAGFFQKSVDPGELVSFVHQFLDEAAVT